MWNDTIAAPATPPGEGGIAIIRLSGPNAGVIAAALFDRPLRDHHVVVGRLREPATGELIDEAIAILMKAPRSFTREDVVEFHCHGGRLVVDRTLQLLLAHGARAAEPGEFTLRAFLNGRIDLAQAESVLDVVRARTDAAHRIAILGLQGRISGAVSAVREMLLAPLAYLIARVDFPDEDVPAEDIRPALAQAATEIERLLAGARAGALYRDGARVALVGPPNAGKSSLLNRLLREDRAIVTPVAGTTRDTLAETADIGGIPVTLIDTAGLSDSPDEIEAIGIERTHQAAAAADAVLVVLDAAAPAPDLPSLLALTDGRPAIAVLNKCDLPPMLRPDQVPLPAVAVSALHGDGITALEASLADLLTTTHGSSHAELLVANPRHAGALHRSLEHIRSATSGLATGTPDDLISIDLRAALDALGEITGETAGEDLLDTIFRRFCIGK